MEASTLRLPPRLPRLRPLRSAHDDDLVTAVRADDPRAFEAIYDRYQRPLLSFCRHMLGSREEAEDALQQTFLAAHRHIGASAKPIHLRPWLFTIARNQCLSILRVRRDTAELDDAAIVTDGLSAEVQRREDLRHTLTDLRRLPEDQRAAMLLSELGALSHEEIAAVIGSAPRKVKALVFQARSSLAVSRTARETPCSEVREQLATLRGSSLRRSGLRRHVRDCPGCKEFEREVRRQRQAMAVLLPVVPAAGLKAQVLAGVAMSGAGGAAVGAAASGSAGVATGLGAAIGKAGGAKLIAAGALAAGAGAGTAALEQRSRAADRPVAPPASQAPRHGEAPAGRPGSSRAGDPGSLRRGRAGSRKRGSSHDSPGRAGTSPGRAGTSRGRAGTSPGRAGTSPGRARSNPNRAGVAPARGIAPGRRGTAPKRAGNPPGPSSRARPPGQPGQGSGPTPGGSAGGPPQPAPSARPQPQAGQPAAGGVNPARGRGSGRGQ